MISVTSNEFETQTVVRNLDFLLRKDNLQLILFACDFPKEPLVNSVVYLANSLQEIYQRKVLVLDFGEDHSISSNNYQNLNELDVVLNNGIIDEAKLKIYIDECKKHYDQILVTPHIKLNREETILPNCNFDGAIVLRSKRSTNPANKNVITNKIIDAQIKINALLDVGV